MKINMFSFIIILSFVNLLFSQIDTTLLNFYPLHNHDYWQYHSYSYEWWPYPYSFSSYYSLEVKGDTILGNGQEYKIIEKVHLDSLYTNYFYYERIDSSTMNVYRFDSFQPGGEYLIDSLESQIGDTSTASRSIFGISIGSYCDSIFDGDILSTFTTTKRIKQIYLLHNEYHHLSYGFGVTYQYADYDFGYTTIDLVYARINGNEYGQAVKINDNKYLHIINSVILYPNYPNPFNSETTFSFYIDQPQTVELIIYTIEGRQVDKILLRNMSQGHHKIKWNLENLSSGVYIYQLRADMHKQSKKLILLK